MKRASNLDLDIVKASMEILRLEIQHHIKMIRTDIEEVKR